MTTELRDIGNSTFKMLLDIKWTLKGGGGGGGGEPRGYSHIVWVGVCHCVCKRPTLLQILCDSIPD